MGDRELKKIADFVTDRTSRRDFLGWLGRMAAGLVGTLGFISLGATNMRTAYTCASVEPWEMNTAGIEVCACDANEAVADLLTYLNSLCSGVPGIDWCQSESCPGDTEEEKRCIPVLIPGSATVRTRAATAADACPNNCATNTPKVVAYVEGTYSCKCTCKPPITATGGRCDTAPRWSIHRRIIAPEAHNSAEAIRLIKEKAAKACRESTAAKAHCEQGYMCNPKRTCKTITSSSPTGSYPNQTLDGEVKCECWCATE